MSKSGLVNAHLHHWKSIVSDLNHASENGLNQAKAGDRDWWESKAVEWARAKGKLLEGTTAGADASSALATLLKLPRRTHRIDDE